MYNKGCCPICSAGPCGVPRSVTVSSIWTCFVSSKWSHQWVFCKSDCQKQGNLRKTVFFLTKNERGWPTFLNSGDPVFDSQINKNPSDGSILRVRNRSKIGVPRLFRTYQTPHRWEHVANCSHFEAKFESFRDDRTPFWTSFGSRKWSHQWGFCESDCQKQGNIGDLMTLGITVLIVDRTALQGHVEDFDG